MIEELRGALAAEVFDCVFDGCESFREQNIGADLAYLLGAILGATGVDWTRENYGENPPAILTILRAKFPAESPVWQFITLTP